jgi:hypothetical protein
MQRMNPGETLSKKTWAVCGGDRNVELGIVVVLVHLWDFLLNVDSTALDYA